MQSNSTLVCDEVFNAFPIFNILGSIPKAKTFVTISIISTYQPNIIKTITAIVFMKFNNML